MKGSASRSGHWFQHPLSDLLRQSSRGAVNTSYLQANFYGDRFEFSYLKKGCIVPSANLHRTLITLTRQPAYNLAYSHLKVQP
ncbi:hypothetical protein E2C01_057444 [Portunus trituberculatus]|uniref:Uncharacterized protein n=1 Tax=Portunus trituberculatus TaxID=210409 RepID=A0A5B7H0H9_PORTR|nr:hypothetical protein [Portunus trituberculatus]